jgi:hypothetical protein
MLHDPESKRNDADRRNIWRASISIGRGSFNDLH